MTFNILYDFTEALIREWIQSIHMREGARVTKSLPQGLLTVIMYENWDTSPDYKTIPAVQIYHPRGCILSSQFQSFWTIFSPPNRQHDHSYSTHKLPSYSSTPNWPLCLIHSCPSISVHVDIISTRGLIQSLGSLIVAPSTCPL